jgi:Mg2+ and Co2+ transporter CorA
MSRLIIEEIQNAANEIQRLHKNSHLNSEDSNVVIHQISQQISFFPTLLSQQIRLIANLEKQFGEAFYEKCADEVREIAETAKNVQTSIENLTGELELECSDAHIACAENLTKVILRLNILQQRIAGKMMKSKKESDKH